MHKYPRMKAAALAALVCVSIFPGAVNAQTWRTSTFARQVWSTEPMDVRVEYGMGRLTVRPAASPTLYRFEVRYDEERFAPVSTFDEAGRTLRLGVRSREGSSRPGREGGTATLELTRAVPLDLKLDFGAGVANLDLGGISLKNLEVSTGASETTLRFSEPNPIRAERLRVSAGAASLEVLGLGNARAERVVFEGGVGSTLLDFAGNWTGNTSASVKMGMGSVTLRVPRDVGMRVNRSAVLTRFTADGLTERDGTFFTPNWETAARKLAVDIEAAFGTVKIEWGD
jgi:hypothetical protein